MSKVKLQNKSICFSPIKTSFHLAIPLLLSPSSSLLLSHRLMELQARSVEMFFFPFVGGGHLIPMIDLARLFSSHGVKASIITFPNDVAVFQKSIKRDQQSGLDIKLLTLQVPAGDAGLSKIDMSSPPFTDTSALQEPLKQILKDCPTDCIVADAFHRWVADVTDEVGVPRITFNGNCCFASCCEDSLERHSPHTEVNSDSEPFRLPGLPDRIELTRSQLPPVFFRTGKEVAGKMMRAEHNSYGQVVNSFYELEPAYVDHCRNVMGKKVWLVGPVSLCNKNLEDKTQRGQKASIDERSCLGWLHSKKPNSVLYVSFGSLARPSTKQIYEIACGLEDSGHPFIWVVGKILDNGGKDNNNFPDGFEERMIEKKKGLIIKGWAPQLLILEHEAIGGFMTHCGWNSTLEGVCAGVPMITWPLSGEQFSNEKLVADVLKIGVRVGSEEWASWQTERKVVVGREKVGAAVARLMSGGEEVTEMRRRVKGLAEMGRRAMEEGGSSFSDVNSLIQELKSRRPEVEVAVAGRLRGE